MGPEDRERRHQPFWVTVQLPGGVSDRLPLAPARAGPLEFRQIEKPEPIRKKVAVIDTFRGKATARMHDGGLANWALRWVASASACCSCSNHPPFMQNLILPRANSTPRSTSPPSTSSATASVACPASMNCGGRSVCGQLTSFEDFIDKRPDVSGGGQKLQRETRRISAGRCTAAQVRREQADHLSAAQSRRPADQRLPRSPEW